MVGWPYILQQFYELFLLVFRPQPNDPHRLVTQPLSLKCYPQYSRLDNISFVYSSSLSKAATVPIKNESLYTTFMVYFMDYRPPNIFIQRTYSKLMKKRGIFTTRLIINQRSHNQLWESLQPLFFICFTKVRKFWETIKLMRNFFWLMILTNSFFLDSIIWLSCWPPTLNRTG